MEPRLKEYDDLLANVRWDSKFHSIRDLVQPWDPDVIEVAAVLSKAPDFAEACHAWVHAFTEYQEEVGDYWRTPHESMEQLKIDCDDSAILLCSLLRNYIPPDRVFCAVGSWYKGGRGGGHMWVEIAEPDGTTRILESTASSTKELSGRYETSALFNDEYAFSTDYGLKLFGFIPTEEVIKTLILAGALPPGS